MKNEKYRTPDKLSHRRGDLAEMFRLRRDAPPLNLTIGLSPG